MARTKRKNRLAFAVRILWLMLIVAALAAFGSSRPLLAQASNTLASSTAELPDSAAKLTRVANTHAETMKTDGGCDSNDDTAADKTSGDNHSPTTGDDKAVGASDTANDDDGRDDTDTSGNRDQKQVAQLKNEGSDQKDDSGCDQHDGDASDSGDEQDADASAPDDQQRNYQETKVDLYRDSQGYKTATVTAHDHRILNNFLLDLTRTTVAASDAAGSVRSEDTTFSFLANLNENFGIGGGFGSVYSQGWSLPIGSLKTTASLGSATLEAGLSRSLLAISAQTIRNRVMQTDASVNLSYELTKDFASSLEFHHINYSDHNSSIGLEFAPQYTFHLRASQLLVGYYFNYESFATNPNNGYWAPQKLIANKLTSVWKFDRGYYFGRIETSLGPESAHQIGSEAGAPQGGFATAAAAYLGIRPSENLVLECNFAGDRSPGWNSTQVGFSIKYFF